MTFNYLHQVNEALDYIRSKCKQAPEIALVLGSGMGDIALEIRNAISIPYSEIPNFPVSTVPGHAGKLVFGELGNKKVVAMQGRFHFYEGYSMQEITLPIRLFGIWEIKKLLLSNAAGGMNPGQELGEVMFIKDHINAMGTNPLIGPHLPEWGQRFPDMSQVYKKDWIELAMEIATKAGQKNSRGVYLAVTGPTYETPAEYKAFRNLGADAVGMSTVPEAIVANQMGMDCLAFSVISDLGVEGKIVSINHEMVVEEVKKVENRMQGIIKEFISKI